MYFVNLYLFYFILFGHPTAYNALTTWKINNSNNYTNYRIPQILVLNLKIKADYKF